MKTATLPMKELEAIATTRFVFGLGLALLLSHSLTSRQRRWAGWTLAILGALSTPRLIYDVYAHRAHD
ncbi:MAG: hypothetical protein ABI680_12595 [Chthoniobacteraceae bacterium]